MLLNSLLLERFFYNEIFNLEMLNRDPYKMNVQLERAYSSRDAFRAISEKNDISRKNWKLRIFFLWPLLLILSILALVIGSNLWVLGSTYHNIFHDIAEVPAKKCALVLGTSPRIQGGQKNAHFINRLEAVTQLYNEGKIEHILVSGDNATKYYNEPKEMKKELVKRNIPSQKITCDFAGFRTLDSIIRAKEIFELSEFIIVSDDFHVPRAIFSAEAKGIPVIAYSSGAVPFKYSARSRFRENLARVKAVFDLYLFKTEPKFLGNKEPIFSTVE